MQKAYLDTETCGLHSMPVLMQWAEENGPIHLHDIWLRPVSETLNLIEWLCTRCVVGFNLTFDWFQIVKLGTILRLLPSAWLPIDHIDTIAGLERAAQEGPCIKPAGALDLMLHSRKGPYQSLMAREDIRIRRVPTALAYELAAELENRVQLDGIYFAKSRNPDDPRWRVYDRERDGIIDPDFKDVVLKFNPAGGLKFLAEHALKLSPKYHYSDVEPDPSWRPIELGYAPFAAAISHRADWAVYEADQLKGYAWPGVIRKFIDHWATNANAREYATDDVVYTRALDKHFGYPTPSDDDSVLACMVAAVRWRGFEIDKPGIQQLRNRAASVVEDSPVNVNASASVREYLSVVMDETERVIIADTTDKAHLEAVGKWLTDDLRQSHPAAIRAKEILKIRKALKEIQLYDKLLLAGKLHAAFVVVGTKSNRMSGDSGLNPQAIDHREIVRAMFPLAWDGYQLSGGDFSGFEVSLADATYGDPKMRQVVLSGRKILGIFGTKVYPHLSYEEIVASDGKEPDWYTPAKQGFYAWLYFGEENTISNRCGITQEAAAVALREWSKEFPGVARAQRQVVSDFTALRQPDGIGGAVLWHEPKEYVESFLGFRRYFTLENAICKALFGLARKPPKHWRDENIKVMRDTKRGRIQTAAGAVASALYGAAFGVSGATVRAAGNHEIQSPGGQITKAVQRAVWDLQPVGIHPLMVAPMNVHDEIDCVTHPDYVEPVAQAVRRTVESFRDRVPLIAMTWYRKMATWASKKGNGTEGEMKIKP